MSVLAAWGCRAALTVFVPTVPGVSAAPAVLTSEEAPLIARSVGIWFVVLIALGGYVLWFRLGLYRESPAGYLLHLAVVPTLVALVASALVGARSLLLSAGIAWLLITTEFIRRVVPAGAARVGDPAPYYFEFLAWLPYYVIVTGALLAGTIAGVLLHRSAPQPPDEE